MAKLQVSAYPLSSEEVEKYNKGYKAFMVAEVSEKAKSQGVYVTKDEDYGNGIHKFLNGDGKGNWALRTTTKSGKAQYVDYDRGIVKDAPSEGNNFGLRVGFDLKYDPNSSIVKGREFKTNVINTSRLESPKESHAFIITYGGKKCVWLNKNECEQGFDVTMKCLTLDIVEKASEFDKTGEVRDFANAKELQEQCERVIKEGCSEEELKMLVPVEMSDEDNYQKTTPALENLNQLSVEALFNALKNDKIFESQLRDGLKAIVDRVYNDKESTVDDFRMLNDIIKEHSEKFDDLLEIEKKMEELKSKEIIDKMNMGE